MLTCCSFVVVLFMLLTKFAFIILPFNCTHCLKFGTHTNKHMCKHDKNTSSPRPRIPPSSCSHQRLVTRAPSCQQPPAHPPTPHPSGQATAHPPPAAPTWAPLFPTSSTLPHSVPIQGSPHAQPPCGTAAARVFPPCWGRGWLPTWRTAQHAAEHPLGAPQCVCAAVHMLHTVWQMRWWC